MYRVAGNPLGFLITNTTILNRKALYIWKINFHPIEVVSRYRDPQPQVGVNYSYLFNFGL